MATPIRKSVTAAAVLALFAGAGAPELGAQASRALPSPIQFALTGITADQTARLTVSAVTDRAVPPGPCRVTLGFVDPHGHPLLNSDGRILESQVTLQAGESAFLDLTSASRTRLNFRPVVVEQSGGGNSSICLPQLEIIDNATQSTVVINPGTAVGGWGTNHNETLLHDAG